MWNRTPILVLASCNQVSINTNVGSVVFVIEADCRVRKQYIKGRGTSFVTLTVTHPISIDRFSDLLIVFRDPIRTPHEIQVHKKGMPCVNSNGDL